MLKVLGHITVFKGILLQSAKTVKHQVKSTEYGEQKYYLLLLLYYGPYLFEQ